MGEKKRSSSYNSLGMYFVMCTDIHISMNAGSLQTFWCRQQYFAEIVQVVHYICTYMYILQNVKSLFYSEKLGTKISIQMWPTIQQT